MEITQAHWRQVLNAAKESIEDVFADFKSKLERFHGFAEPVYLLKVEARRDSEALVLREKRGSTLPMALGEFESKFLKKRQGQPCAVLGRIRLRDDMISMTPCTLFFEKQGDIFWLRLR